MDVALAMKILAPLAGRAGAAFAPSLLRPWQVSFEAWRKARKEGIRTDYFALRKLIVQKRLFDLFEKPSEEELKALELSIKRCIRNPDDDAGSRLLALLATSYVHSLAPSAATHFENEKTRKHVSNAVKELEEKSIETQGFQTNCEFLNAFRAEGARELLPHWRQVPHAVAAVVTSQDPHQLINDWSVHRPDWMEDAPASGLTWLSSLAKDFGADAAAQEFLRQALAAGASPRSYWTARYVLAAPLSQKQAEDELASAQHHPLAAALWADVEGDFRTALERIHAWHPISSEDLAIKHLLVAKLLAATDDVDQAIAVTLEGYDKYGSEDCALFAANLLVAKGSRRDYPNFLKDLNKALQLAKSARSSRRKWRGDGSEATLAMMTAYRLLGAPEQAWQAGRPSPEGTATVQESTDVRVRFELARAAAETGRIDRARELLQGVDEDSDKVQVEARIVEVESGFISALPLWKQALATATDPSEALNIGLRLALNGQAIEWPEWIIPDYEAEAADVDLLSALHQGTQGSVPCARARATSSPRVASGLIAFHISKGEYAAAAEVAEDMGRRWNDPETWLRAAEIRLKAEELDRSVTAAEQAIRVGGQGWLGEHEARKLLIQVRSSQGQWEQSLVDAARLLELTPENTSAKWAYIICQFMTGDYKGAWDSYIKLNSPKPEKPDHARIWLHLHSRFAPNLDHVDEALDIASHWEDDETLRAAIVVSFMRPTGADLPSKKQVQQIQQLREQFFADFPKSKHLWAVTLDTGDPLKSLTDALQPVATPDDALDPVIRGDLPLGFATNIKGKGYAELCLTRGSVRFFSGDQGALESELRDLDASFDQRVVLDVSALSTIALLGDQARKWLGYFSAGVVPTATIHDAQRAVSSLSSKSTMSLGFDAVTNKPRILEISELEAEGLLECANALLDAAKGLTAISHPQILNLPHIQADHQEFHWLLALDMAKTEGLSFWCDDRILRAAARSLGLRTFGTFALMEALHRNGMIEKSLSQAMSSRLIHSYYVGTGFDPLVMQLAAQMDSWLPKGAAAALSESGPTATPQQQIAFGLTALQRNVGSPEAIQGWVISVAQWLNTLSADTWSRRELTKFWFSTILEQPWINSSSLPFVIAGLRAVSPGPDMDEVIPEAFADLYLATAARTTHALAAEYVKELSSNMAPEDRSRVIRRLILNG